MILHTKLIDERVKRMLNQIKERPKSNEIWMCNLVTKNGSVQSGYRPVFVLSNNLNNTYSPTLNIIPITSRTTKKKLPVHVELSSYEDYGLKAPSTMLVEQITTVPVENLDRCVGTIDNHKTLENIRQAVCVQFPIMQMQLA